VLISLQANQSIDCLSAKRCLFVLPFSRCSQHTRKDHVCDSHPHKQRTTAQHQTSFPVHSPSLRLGFKTASRATARSGIWLDSRRPFCYRPVSLTRCTRKTGRSSGTMSSIALPAPTPTLPSGPTIWATTTAGATASSKITANPARTPLPVSPHSPTPTRTATATWSFRPVATPAATGPPPGSRPRASTSSSTAASKPA